MNKRTILAGKLAGNMNKRTILAGKIAGKVAGNMNKRTGVLMVIEDDAGNTFAI
jgi:outer membrane lipoprotein SlyB